MIRLFRVLFLAGLGALLCFGQPGCGLPGACVNPVSADNITGTWTDTTNATWSLTSSGTSVSGSVSVPNPGCSTVTWTVSGSITVPFQNDSVQGTTSFTWNASNPNPSGTCGGFTPFTSATLAGTIQNNGDDKGTGTFTSPGGSFATTATKSPTDAVMSETTNFVGFGTVTGYLTVGQFRQVLNSSTGSTNIFNGRQVSETTGTGTAFDHCWFPGSSVPKFVTVQGSTWNVGYYSTLDNYWVDDYIGWNTVQVDYYRNHLTPSSFPCDAQIPQIMKIATNGTSGSTTQYTSDTITAIIDATTVTVSRAGVAALTSYP